MVLRRSGFATNPNSSRLHIPHHPLIAGARLLTKTAVPRLRLLFAIVICALALEMIYNSLAGRV